MNTRGSVRNKGNLLTEIISIKKLKSLSKLSGFTRRKERKIVPHMLLLSYMDFINKGSFSFHQWAISLSGYTGKTISKQAIHKRVGHQFILFIQGVLSNILHNQYQQFKSRHIKLFASFENVYLQDATHFSLPLHLAKLFPGNNTGGETRAVAKIDTVFNLNKGCFSTFKLTYFKDADVKSIKQICKMLNRGDLIIRDLGYYIIEGFEAIHKKGAYFLSRHKFNVAIRDINTGAQINLAKYLKKQKQIDTKILLSSKQPIQVRIVAIPLPEAISNERKRKAKANKRNIRTNHNQDYYYLLGYAIFITNVDEDVWTAQDVCSAYRCRWNIEILFKSWKSYLNAHYTSPDRYATENSVKVHFYMLLIYISAFVMPILLRIQNTKNKLIGNNNISILKLTSYITNNFTDILNNELSKKSITKIIYYSKYDTRNDRFNAMQKLFIRT